MGLSTNSFD